MKPAALAPLLLVVGIAIGFGAAVLLMGSGEAPRGSSAAPITREEAAGSGGADAKELAAPGALPRAASSGGSDSAAASDARAVLSRAAESARVAAAGAEESDGAGSFRGVVRDTSGAPVAGAVVLASPVRPRRDAYELGASTSEIGRAWDGHLPIESYYVEPMTRVLEERRLTRTATTDDEGRFVLEGLPAGRHSLNPFAEGFQGERLEANTGAEVELWLVPIASFEIEPRLPDGSQPERAVIELEADGRRRLYTWSPEEPSLRIPLRVATLKVLAGEVPSSGRRECLGTYTSEQRTIDLDVDGPGPHVFELASTPILRVAMIGADGEDPMESAWVRLDAGEGEPRRLSRIDETTYLIGDVDPGAYTITAGQLPDVEALSEPVRVEAGLNEFALDLPMPDPDDVLVLRCADAEGRPIEEVSMAFEARRPGGGTELLRVDPSPRGRGEWSVPWTALVEDGEPFPGFEITANSEGLGIQRLVLDRKVTTAEFTFEEPCRLTVVVEGRREGGLHVSLWEGDLTSVPEFSTSITWTQSRLAPAVPESGRLELGPIQPGRYSLALLPNNSPWSAFPLTGREVVLRSGRQVETLRVPPLHDLVVQAPASAVGQRLTLSPEVSVGPYRYLMASIDEDGRAVFAGIPVGEYRVRANSAHWSGGEMLVTVPCGVVEFQSAEELGLEIRSIAESAPLGGSALRPGDVVLGTAERRATEEGFWAGLATALAEGPVEVRVLRGGVERGLTLELPETAPGTYPLAGIRVRTALR